MQGQGPDHPQEVEMHQDRGPLERRQEEGAAAYLLKEDNYHVLKLRDLAQVLHPMEEELLGCPK